MNRIRLSAALFAGVAVRDRPGRRAGPERAQPQSSIISAEGRRRFGPATSSRRRSIGPTRSGCASAGGDADLEAQALARRGEAYRIEGYYRDASSDLEEALVKAEQSGDQTLIAAASGALGNLAFMSRRTAVAEPLLERSRDLAARSHDWTTLAASENDLGNLYASTGRPAAAAGAYAQAIANAGAAGDAALAATAETNAARLGLRGNDWVRATALLTRAVDTLASLPPSYANGMALVSAGSAVFEPQGEIPADAQAVAERAFRAAAATAATLHNLKLASLADGSLGHLYELDGPARRRCGPDRAGRVRGAAGLGAGSVVPLGLAAGAPRPPARADRSGAGELSPRRRRIAIGASGHSGRISRRALVLPNHLRPALPRIHRSAAAPRADDPAEAPALIREARDTSKS